MATDLLMLGLACLAGVLLGRSSGAATPLLVVYPPITLILLSSRGRYRRRMLDVALDDLAPGIGAISIGTMTVFLLALLTVGNSQLTSSLIAHTWLASLVLVTVSGTIVSRLENAARRDGSDATPTLIVGADAGGIEIADRLATHPEYGLRTVGFLDSNRTTTANVVGGLGDLADVVRAGGVRRVIVGFPDAPEADLVTLLRACDGLGLETSVVPRLATSINDQTRFEYLGTMPVLNLRAVDPGSRGFACKYAIDRIVAAFLLIVLAPLMVTIAVAVRVSSPGPILFNQRRTGQDNRLFELLKFRTMVVDGDAGPFVPRGDTAPGGIEGADRRTSIGRLLRRTSLDELPQLINVVRGSMSLIGPRPERPEFAAEFGTRFERYSDRARVRSGITGWAQINGSRGQTPMTDRVALDNFYIEHWSLALDAKILARTIPAMFKGS